MSMGLRFMLWSVLPRHRVCWDGGICWEVPWTGCSDCARPVPVLSHVSLFPREGV